MKKVISLLIVAVMMLSLSVAAFAAGGTGSITINGISTENVYEIYKILDLESYDTSSGAYSYKVNSAWTGFFATAEALAYVEIDAAGYVTWKAEENDETVAAFAKLALAYAEAHGIAPVKSSLNAGEFVVTGTTGKFSDLELGYYLIDSTMGALCGLTTTNPDASINAKNGSPILEKQVLEDGTNQWGDSNTADIGQTIYYRVTISVHAGAQNYVFHDKLSDGLTYKQVSKIEHVIPGGTTTDVPASYYTIDTAPADGHTFDIIFTQAFCDHLETNDKIVIYYEAVLNENAIVATTGNPNEAYLTYGEDHSTTHDSTTTYTYGFDIIKTDSQNTLIDGAEFKIYDAATGGNEVKVVKIDDQNYRIAQPSETGVSIVVKNGNVRVVGFDNGTYYLEETVAPDGYNKLTARQKFIIADANLDAIFNGGIYSTGSGVHVVNKTGSMLPETGGLGTLLFTLIGGGTVMGSGVLLVTKKRMSKIEDEE